MELVFLCTGNICRSPMAEVLMVREAAMRPEPVIVSSAGFVTENRAAEPHAVTVMGERGLDLTRHRSRLVDPEMLEADLVVGMTREHVRDAFGLHREAFPRTFTLKELVRRGRAVGPASAGLEPWLDEIATTRDSADLLGDSRADDIADPMGRSLRVFRACADEIEDQIVALAGLLSA